MIKKTVLFFILFCASLLVANDTLDTFIDEQVTVEAALLDQNLSLDEKVLIKKKQESSYDKFFIGYVADDEEHLESNNPYTAPINRLKLSLNTNKYQGNTTASLRDEVLLKSLYTRLMIRQILHETLQATKGTSRTFFKEKVNDILTTHLSKYQLIEAKKYLSFVTEQNSSSPIADALLKAVKSQEYLENVINTFSSSLVANSANIYITSRISGSKFLHVLNRLNTTPFGLEANRYLSVLGLNVAKLILIASIITFIFLINRILGFIINRVLLHFKIRPEDIDYINTRITKLFNLITSILIVHIILVATMDLDHQGININQLFGIVYVVLVSILLYRISNTVIAMRTEQIKKSKVLKNEVVNLIIKVNNSLIILAALIVILRIFGVDLTALLSGLGIAGAAVAFAAKDSIANIFGSVSILAGEVFEQGDWIETKDVNGTVVEIGLRGTTIRTADNALISIPNSQLANFSVKNWSRRSIGRMIQLRIGITYQSNFDNIRNAIAEIRSMLTTHPDIANEETHFQNTYRESRLVSVEDYKGIKRSTLVYMDAFEDSSIIILVECFSQSVDREAWLSTKEDILFKIADILAKNNLGFAYPSLAVYSGDKESIGLS